MNSILFKRLLGGDSVFTKNVLANGLHLEVPFKRRDGMFKLTIGVCRPTGSAAGLKSGLHAATSRSHIAMLPADEAAASLHLHVSLNHITNLHENTAGRTCPHLPRPAVPAVPAVPVLPQTLLQTWASHPCPTPTYSYLNYQRPLIPTSGTPYAVSPSCMMACLECYRSTTVCRNT
jgi:hypothetical protein